MIVNQQYDANKKIKGKSENKNKGKSAYSTHYRRIVWEYVIMPLLQEIERPYFSVEEYRNKRDEVSERLKISPKKLSYGLISLTNKKILEKEKEKEKRDVKVYSVNHKLEPYVKKKERIDYGTAINTSKNN